MKKYLNYDVKRGRKNKEDSELLSELKIRALSDYQIFEYIANMIKENPEITETEFVAKFETHSSAIRGILSGYTDGHWYHVGNKFYEKFCKAIGQEPYLYMKKMRYSVNSEIHQSYSSVFDNFIDKCCERKDPQDPYCDMSMIDLYRAYLIYAGTHGSDTVYGTLYSFNHAFRESFPDVSIEGNAGYMSIIRNFGLKGETKQKFGLCSEDGIIPNGLAPHVLVLDFIDKYCEIDPSTNVLAMDLYEAYRKYALERIKSGTISTIYTKTGFNRYLTEAFSFPFLLSKLSKNKGKPSEKKIICGIGFKTGPFMGPVVVPFNRI